MSAPVVIAGGGLAGQRFAETLRRRGFDGRVVMLCGEPVAPYDRPPLSKELLLGARAPHTLRFRDDAWYADNEVELELGTRAVGLDPHTRRVELSDGRRLEYATLLVATGAVPAVPPPLRGYDNVLTLRDVSDACALMERLSPGRRLVVVGGGFVGLEVAATASALGAEVMIVEAAPAPLAGPLGVEVGSWFARLHRERGIATLTGAGVATAHGHASIRELELEDGTRLPADTVLAAVGAVPDTRWLAAAGVPERRIPVDGTGATAIPGVLAAGDVTGHLHWEAAARDGANAAHTLLGLAPARELPPGFWSDQHGVRFQLVGDTAGAQRTTLDGDPGACDFTVTYWRDERAVAILLAGRPAELPSARRAIAHSAGEPETERSAA